MLNGVCGKVLAQMVESTLIMCEDLGIHLTHSNAT